MDPNTGWQTSKSLFAHEIINVVDKSPAQQLQPLSYSPPQYHHYYRITHTHTHTHIHTHTHTHTNAQANTDVIVGAADGTGFFVDDRFVGSS